MDTENGKVVEEAIDAYKYVAADDLKKLSDNELDKMVTDLNKVAEEHAKMMEAKLYPVHMETQNKASNLKNFIEKEANWDHKSVPNLVAMCYGLKESVKVGVDEDGFIHLNARVVNNIYQFLLSFTGKGYQDAKKYLKLLTEVGGPISEAMKIFADDNQLFRDIHTDLATIDTEQTARKQGIEVTPTTDTKEA